MWADLSDIEILMNKMNKVPLPLPASIPAPLAALIRKCVATNVAERPEFVDIQVRVIVRPRFFTVL